MIECLLLNWRWLILSFTTDLSHCDVSNASFYFDSAVVEACRQQACDRKMVPVPLAADESKGVAEEAVHIAELDSILTENWLEHQLKPQVLRLQCWVRLPGHGPPSLLYHSDYVLNRSSLQVGLWPLGWSTWIGLKKVFVFSSWVSLLVKVFMLRLLFFYNDGSELSLDIGWYVDRCRVAFIFDTLKKYGNDRLKMKVERGWIDLKKIQLRSQNEQWCSCRRRKIG